jgi:hypothetical protein
MSKIMLATPIWLGEACSDRAVLFHRIGLVPDVFFEQLHSMRCDSLKYFQVKCPQHKIVAAEGNKSDKLVQETFSFRRQT